MLKILFQFLKTLPSFQKLLAEWFAEERGKTEKALADYRLKSLSDAADIEKLRGEARDWRGEARDYYNLATERLAAIHARDAEIARLKLETEKKLAAVDSLSSEDVFNTTLYSPKPAPVLRGDPPATKRQSADELRWNRS